MRADCVPIEYVDAKIDDTNNESNKTTVESVVTKPYDVDAKDFDEELLIQEIRQIVNHSGKNSFKFSHLFSREDSSVYAEYTCEAGPVNEYMETSLINGIDLSGIQMVGEEIYTCVSEKVLLKPIIEKQTCEETYTIQQIVDMQGVPVFPLDEMKEDETVYRVTRECHVEPVKSVVVSNP